MDLLAAHYLVFDPSILTVVFCVAIDKACVCAYTQYSENDSYILIRESLEAGTLILLPFFNFVTHTHLTQKNECGHTCTHTYGNFCKTASFKGILITHLA